MSKFVKLMAKGCLVESGHCGFTNREYQRDTLSASLLPSITRAISTCGGFSGALFLFPHLTANKTRLNKKGSRINVWLIKH